jgi:biotin carboxyl carrier protein
MNVSFWVDKKEYRMNLAQSKENHIQVSLGRRKYEVSVEFLGPDEILLNIDGKVHNVIINSNASSYSVYLNGRCFQIEKKSALQILGPKAGKQKKVNVQTSMPGRIVKVLRDEGEAVEEGQAVLILEAMKMQNEIKSPQSGRLTKIGPKPGESVETGALLFTVE